MAAGNRSWCSNSDTISAPIIISTAASAECDTRGLTPLALEIPTGAGSFTALTIYIAFKVGMTSGALDYLRSEDGTLYKVTISANNTNGRAYLSATAFAAGWHYVQLITLAADGATTVNQAAARAIVIVGGKVV
jgi:hypothetical protein